MWMEGISKHVSGGSNRTSSFSSDPDTAGPDSVAEPRCAAKVYEEKQGVISHKSDGQRMATWLLPMRGVSQENCYTYTSSRAERRKPLDRKCLHFREKLH